MSQDWIKPNELIQQHRLKQKRKKGSFCSQNQAKENTKNAEKRKNSNFLSPVRSKKQKIDNIDAGFTESLQNNPEQSEELSSDNYQYYENIPVDWNIKTRARFFCQSEFSLTNLTDRQFANGLMGFVGSIDGNIPAIQLNQATYYWQYPHLPWMSLFPRKSKQNCDIVLGELERRALLSEWHCSFRGLFQLLRASECPYFYMCANNFTVLFRAAHVGGCNEMHALMSPTALGMRKSLQQECIDFSMPLRTNTLKTDISEVVKTKDEAGELDVGNSKEDDEEEEEDWLRSLGVNESEIRKINTIDKRQIRQKDTETDFSHDSTVLIKGVDCQAFFNFLLNAKSTVNQVGRLAGIPPTLLSPCPFPKATLENLSVSTKKLSLDGEGFYSFEMKGIILPTAIQQICELLSKTENTFSATLASHNSTFAFDKASQKILGSMDESKDMKSEQTSPKYGFSKKVTNSICRIETSAVGILEQVRYDINNGYSLN